MSALISKVPLKAELALMPRRRMRGDDGHEERAIMELTPDPLIPGVAASQLTLVEPDLYPGGAKCIANALRRLGILRGVTQKYAVRGLGHRRDPLTDRPEVFSLPPQAEA